jgi:DNA-binding CsgD family transcriptional regulator
MEKSNQSARITLRQICSLDVPAPVLLPSLLKALRQIVPASHAAFFYCDEEGNMLNLYAERLLSPSIMAAYYEKHFGSEDSGFRDAYLRRTRSARRVSRHSLTKLETESSYYKEILSKLDAHHFLYAIVGSAKKPVGQLSLYRSAKDHPFSASDEQDLDDVLRYLNEVLVHPTVTKFLSNNVQVAEESLAILDSHGNVLFSDPTWDRLIRLARGEVIAPNKALSEIKSMPQFVISILDTLRNAPNAVHTSETMWGQFRFRSHQLSDPFGSTPAAALIVSRIAPESVRIAEGAAQLGLSSQQREVALLIASGLTNAEIAQRLNISVNTVAYHVKAVFNRLGVFERADVAPKLRAAVR